MLNVGVQSNATVVFSVISNVLATLLQCLLMFDAELHVYVGCCQVYECSFIAALFLCTIQYN